MLLTRAAAAICFRHISLVVLRSLFDQKFEILKEMLVDDL